MRKQSSPIDIEDLGLFVRVVDGRSFSAAAKAQGTTTSAASKRVARLEERLGVRLLERTTRRVLPTEAGAAFYNRASRLLSDLDDAENEIASLGGSPRGTLRVSAPILLGERHVAPLLAPFLTKYPQVRVELSLTDTFVNLLADRIDVALRVGPLADSTLVKSRVGTATSIVVASPSYLARAGKPEVPRDLVRHNCLRYSNMTAAREWRFKSKRGEETIPVVGNLEVNSGGAMREAVAAGIGIARLPDFLVVDLLHSGHLVPLLHGFETAESGIHWVYPSGPTPPTKLQAFVEEVGAALRARLLSVTAECTKARKGSGASRGGNPAIDRDDGARQVRARA